MAYVNTLNIVNTTSTGLTVASNAYVADADAKLVYLKDHAVAKDFVVLSGGTLQALTQDQQGCLVDGATVNGGSVQVILRYAGNSGANVKVSSGTFYVQQGASATNTTQTGGEIAVSGVIGAYSYISKASLQGGSCVLTKFANAHDITVAGGTLYVNNSANAYGINQTAGSTVISGLKAVAVGGTIAGGKITVSIGGVASNVNIEGAARAWVESSAVWSGGVISGTGENQAYDAKGGGIFRGVTLQKGALVIRWAGNLADTIQVDGGTLYIQSGGSGANITQNGGTVNITQDGSVVDGMIYNAGTFNVSSGTTVKNLRKVGATTVNLYGNGVVDGGAVSAGTLQALVGNGADGAVIKNYAISAGATIIVRGATNRAENITVSKGTMHVQGGATVNGAEVLNGGTIVNNNIANEVVSNLTLRTGAIGSFTAGTGRLVGLTMEDGATLTLTAGDVSGGAAAGGTLNFTDVNLYDFAMTGGALNASGTLTASGGTLVNVNQTAGVIRLSGGATLDGGIITSDLHLASGGTAKNIEVNGATGKLYVYSSGVVEDVVLGPNTTANRVYISSGGVARRAIVRGGEFYVYTTGGAAYASDVKCSGGLFILRYTGNLAENVQVYDGGTFHIQSGASARDIAQTGGVTYAANGELKGGTIAGGTIKFGNFTVSGVTMTGGDAAASGNFYVSETTLKDLSVTAGKTYVYDGSLVSGGKITGGEIRISSGAVASNFDVAARAWVSSGGLWSGGVISASELDNYDSNGGGLVRGVTMVGGAVIVRSGGNIASAVQVSGGILYVQNGGSAVDIDVYAGGTLGMGDRANGILSNVRVSNGGFISGTEAGHSYADITVEAGGEWTLGNDFKMTGDINFAAGALTGDADAYAQNGVIYQYDQSVAGSYGNGITLSNCVVNNSAYFTDGAEARNVTLIGAAGNRIYVSNGGKAYDTLVAGGSMVFLDAAGGGYASGAILRGGDMIVRYADNLCETIAISGNTLHVQSGASAHDVAMETGTINIEGATGKLSELVGATIANGTLNVSWQGSAQNVNMTGGSVNVKNGGVLSAVAGNTLYNVNTVAGAKVAFVKDGGQATLAGANTTIAEGTLWYDGTTQMTGHGTNGVIEGLGAGDEAYKLSIGSDIVLSNATGNNFETRISAFSGAKLDGVLFGAGAIIGVNGASVEFNNVTLSGGHGSTCNLNLSAGGQTASNTVIGGAGAKLQIFGADARIENTTLLAGGSMNLAVAGIDTGELVTLDFTGTTGNQTVDITNLSRLAAGTTLAVRGVESGATYTFTKGSSATDKTLDLGQYSVFDMTVAAGSKYSNGFLGVSYDFTTGKSLTTTSFTVSAQTTAAELDSTNATVLADGGLATKWTSTTDVTTLPAAVAGANTSGDAWLTVEGANLATALYGAEGNFAHDVNLWLYEGTVRNLAAGATAGGSVENVNLLVSDNGEDGMNFTGVAYAGGFGNVTGEVKAELYGGTFEKDFYAGALANKLTTTTSVGNVSMTIDSGMFSGNIFGASAVKTVAGKNGTRHTAGDVTLTITNGETTKGTQACIFAGGYATGDATGTVYTVDSVTATISGGSWGEAAGGRGVFGGVMASGVEAEVLGNVNLTVSGDATMGNVYGGGWAQKTNGKSIVGDVSINITGGTIANVFGGGSHSTSGGSTEAGEVTITVSGGNITGAIYAKGQLDGDTTGAANVIFTGANDFACDVFGYSYVGGAASDAALTFNSYTGTFSGAIGGFDNVTFTDGTAMTLATAAADISNGAWEFDLTDRADALADTSFLTWANADFASDTIKVSFADDTQAQSGWNIATVAEAFSGTTFDVEIGGAEIVSGLAYKGQIASGDYAGWGFELESGVLKFKQLA